MEGAQWAAQARDGRAWAGTLHLVVRCLPRVKVSGVGNLSRARATVMVANRRDDADRPVIGSVPVGKRDLCQAGVLIHCVTRQGLSGQAFLRVCLEG